MIVILILVLMCLLAVSTLARFSYVEKLLKKQEATISILENSLKALEDRLAANE